MEISRPAVRRAAASEHAASARTLGEAFGTDPIMEWMIGADRDVAGRMEHYFSHTLHHHLGHADHLVDTVGDVDAVAIWHEIDTWRTPRPELLKMARPAIRTFGRRLPHAMRVLASIEKVHPTEPHRFLGFLGVRPSKQGKGLGGVLLAAMTEELDEQGIPAYLENSNPRNEALYARHGFVSRGLISLPTGAPPMSAMWRDPR